MNVEKPSLAELAAHLELLAKGQDIITRLAPHNGRRPDDLVATCERTLDAAKVLRAMAPYQDELRKWLRERRAQSAEEK